MQVQDSTPGGVLCFYGSEVVITAPVGNYNVSEKPAAQHESSVEGE